MELILTLSGQRSQKIYRFWATIQNAKNVRICMLKHMTAVWWTKAKAARELNVSRATITDWRCYNDNRGGWGGGEPRVTIPAKDHYISLQHFEQQPQLLATSMAWGESLNKLCITVWEVLAFMLDATIINDESQYLRRGMEERMCDVYQM